MSDGFNFCTQLCSKTSGVVSIINEVPSAEPPSDSSSSASCKTPSQKRGSSAMAPRAKKRKGGYQEEMSILEEEIPEHQIGMQTKKLYIEALFAFDVVSL